MPFLDFPFFVDLAHQGILGMQTLPAPLATATKKHDMTNTVPCNTEKLHVPLDDGKKWFDTKEKSQERHDKIVNGSFYKTAQVKE